jgi:hypothetical protein
MLNPDFSNSIQRHSYEFPRIPMSIPSVDQFTSFACRKSAIKMCEQDRSTRHGYLRVPDTDNDMVMVDHHKTFDVCLRITNRLSADREFGLVSGRNDDVRAIIMPILVGSESRTNEVPGMVMSMYNTEPKIFRSLRSSTDVVSVVQRRNDIEYATDPVVQRGKNHTMQELMGASVVIDGLHDIAAVGRIMGVELRGDTLDFTEPLITRSDGMIDCPPPFICGGTVGKYDQVLPIPVIVKLERGNNCGVVLKDRWGLPTCFAYA